MANITSTEKTIYTPFELFGVECMKGWKDLIVPLVQKCKDEGVVITQIKEKFGTLRFYTSACSDELFDMICEAEEKSAHICEICGKPGKVRGEYWLETRCDEHAMDKPID